MELIESLQRTQGRRCSLFEGQSISKEAFFILLILQVARSDLTKRGHGWQDKLRLVLSAKLLSVVWPLRLPLKVDLGRQMSLLRLMANLH